MKKIIFTVLIIAMATWVKAQIVIVNSNVASVGTTIVQANDTLPDATIVPGNAGENQTWNFSTLHEHYYDTISTELPSWTPYADSFPFANYAIESMSGQDTVYAYFIKNEDAFSNIGYAGFMAEAGTVLTLHVVPEEVVIDFPMQYGNQRDETFYVDKTIVSPTPGPDSIRFKHTTVKHLDVDAWGSITIPMGTYDALRTKTVRQETDSTWVLLFGVWNFITTDTSTTVSYDWYTNELNPDFTLMSMDYTNNTAKNVNFLKGVPVGIRQNKQKSVVIYPNPVKEKAVIQLDEYVSGLLNIFDFSGRKVFQKVVNGRTINANLSNLTAGTYFVVITEKNNPLLRFTGKLIKE